MSCTPTSAPPPAPLSARHPVYAVALFLLVATAVARFVILYVGSRDNDDLSQASAPLWPVTDRVTLVVLDGVPAEVLASAEHYPTVAGLVQQGSPIGRHAVPDGFSTTGPIVYAMGTGTASQPTQILSNFSSGASNQDSLFRVLRRHGKTSAVFGEKIWADLFGPYIDIASVQPDHGLSDLFDSDEKTLHAALNTRDDYDLMVVHFIGSDHAGHRFDFADETYRRVSRTLDGYLAALLERYSDRHFIILADHGMSHDRSHVRDEPAVVRPPLLLVGPRFQRGQSPALRTVQIPVLITTFLGVSPPASATEPPPFGLLALDANQEALLRKSFHEEVILRRHGTPPGEGAPRTWDELADQNRASLARSQRVPFSVHLQALGLFGVGLLGLALYRCGLTRVRTLTALALPLIIASWLIPGIYGLGLLIATAAALALSQRLALVRDALVELAPPYAAVALVCVPFAASTEHVEWSTVARFAPAALASGALLVALALFVRRRASLSTLIAITALWSMHFMAHRWPQGSAHYALTALSIAAVAWIARASGEGRAAPVLGAILVAAAWIPSYLAGGAPTRFNGLGSGLHLVAEGLPIRAAAGVAYASFLFWLWQRRDDRRTLAVVAAALTAPALAFTHTGFAIEATCLGIYLLLLVASRSYEARLAAASACLVLLSSSAQIIAITALAWGFSLLRPALRRAPSAAGERLSGILLVSCLYILGMALHVGRIENSLPNPDLIVPPTAWIIGTVGLVFLKTSLVAALLLLCVTPSPPHEDTLLRFALLGALPLALLYQRGYRYGALNVTPTLLLFAAAVLFSRVLLAAPSSLHAARSRLAERALAAGAWVDFLSRRGHSATPPTATSLDDRAAALREADESNLRRKVG